MALGILAQTMPVINTHRLKYSSVCWGSILYSRIVCHWYKDER